MKVWIDGTTYRGRAVDLRARDIDGRTVAAAVRGARRYPPVDAAAPSRVYDYAGHVHAEMGLRARTALAAAARSRGHRTAHDEEIARLQAALSDTAPSSPSIGQPSAPVSDDAVAELREAVAKHRGRVQARETLDRDASGARSDLRETAARLTERETEQTATTQARERRRERARAYRDEAAERRRLADRLANSRRDARAELVESVADQFRDAVGDAPGPTPADPFDADAVTAALAVLRVARTDAPVVVAVDRFGDPAAAADWLDAPVVRC